MKHTARICGLVLGVSLFASWAHAVSEDPLQQFKLASLAYQNGRFDSAEQEYEGFVKNFSNHRLAAQARLALAEIKFAQKKYPEAISQMEQAAALIPNNAQMWAYVGFVQLQAGDVANAQKNFTHALSLDPANQIAHAGLAKIRQP